jgi:hypothetical protein
MLAGQKGGGALEGVEGQDQEEEVEVEIVEDIGEEADVGDQELEAPSYGGGPPPAGGGAGDGSGDGDPWDVGRLFGGDDDDDDPTAPTRTGRLAPSPRRSLPSPLDDPFEERPDELLRDEDLEPMDHLLGPTPERPDAERLGDSCFVAVEAALADPRALGRRALEPEDLIDAEGTSDPLGRPSEIGRFLAAAAESPRARALGRTLATATAALAPVASGYAGAAARLCSLAVCAEALEGGGDRTDRAVTLALAWGAWPEAVDAARPMAQEGRLHAHEVLDTLVGEVAEKDPERRRLPAPSRLGGKALQRVVPEPYLPEVPLIDLEAMDRHDDPDPGVAELDRWLDALVQGGDPAAEPDPDPPVDPQLLQPALHAARYLMNAIGRGPRCAARCGWPTRPCTSSPAGC